MLVDLLIIGFGISALFRGYEIGFTRQMLSTVGFFGGLFLGAWLQHYTVSLAHTDASRSLVTALTTLGCAIILLTLGEYIGLHLKHRLLAKRLHALDNWFGSVVGMLSLLLSVWLLAAILASLPITSIQSPIRQSKIIKLLDNLLPDAPSVIADLGRLVDPNGFPDVFIGSEPVPRSNINLPSLGALQAAVSADRDSVVKIEGQGCGGIVEGSGFVVGPNLVATNAHVIAGIRRPFVADTNGNRRAAPVWYDPNLDFAVLRVDNLAGKPLPLNDGKVSPGTAAAVLGYPGGGGLSADPAAVLDGFNAQGRNIYNQGRVVRSVYEIQANVIPGNSGGPMVGVNGKVLGIVFAQSTSYQHVGYALSLPQVIQELQHVSASGPELATGSCAE